jgi:hypothetical protein
VSSNKLLKLLVTESGSNRGLGSSRIYGGVLISNIGGWSKCRSEKVGGGNVEGDGAAAWKKDSCIDISSASAGVEVEEASEGLAAGGSGGLFKTIESARVSRGYISTYLSILRFCRVGATLFENVVSSNGLHLKSFLYPPHTTLLLWHCWHDGFVSSHFNRFALHVIHPIQQYSISSYHCQDKTTTDAPNVPLRLLDCLGLETPFCFFVGLADLVVVEGLRFGGGGGSGAGFKTGEERKADGDGIVMVSILTASVWDTSTRAQSETVDVMPLERFLLWLAATKSPLSLQYLGAGGMGGVDAGRAVQCDWRLGWWLPEPKVETREPRV